MTQSIAPAKEGERGQYVPRTGVRDSCSARFCSLRVFALSARSLWLSARSRSLARSLLSLPVLFALAVLCSLAVLSSLAVLYSIPLQVPLFSPF